MDSSSQSPQSEMRGPPNTIPESSENSISSAINVKKPLLQFVKKVTQNKRKTVVVQSNGYAAFAIMYLREATLEFIIIYWLFRVME
jgi:hypothetical protein